MRLDAADEVVAAVDGALPDVVTGLRGVPHGAAAGVDADVGDAAGRAAEEQQVADLLGRLRDVAHRAVLSRAAVRQGLAEAAEDVLREAAAVEPRGAGCAIGVG